MLISNLMMGVRGVVVKPAGTWAGIGTPNKKKTKTKKGISLQTSVYLHHLQDARCKMHFMRRSICDALVMLFLACR
jgi:hypothetical protein